MKALSDSLIELAQRVKRLEESAAATPPDDAQYEQRRAQVDEAIEREVRAFEAAAAELASSVRPRRATGRRPIEGPVGAVRAGTRRGKEESALERAMRTAEIAEQDARAAIALARYSLTSAEYAVLDAALARAEAESFAEAVSSEGPGSEDAAREGDMAPRSPERAG